MDTSLKSLLLGLTGFSLLSLTACTNSDSTAVVGIGGAPANGGTSTAQGGTSTAQGGTSTAQGGTSTAQGGTSTAQGGTSTAQGGTSTAQGGTSTGQGGSANGGGATGGTTGNTGGKIGSGGAQTGGAPNQGGSTQGGSATGGRATGGAGVGGSTAGGANQGGSTTGGVSAGGSSAGGSSAAGSTSNWLGAICTNMGTTPIATAWESSYSAWKTAHVVECGTGMARVKGCQGDTNTCSEGIGYGMLLLVAGNDQALFDKMNAFRKALQALNNAPDTTSGKLMAWYSGDTCPPSASGGNANSATDGDLDAAMALLQAEKRWGGGTYLSEAKTYLEGIWLNQVEKDGSGNPLRLKPGNLPLAQDTRDYISYYAPGYFHVFAKITGQSKWSALADVFYTKLSAQQANCTNGQVPDSFGATDCKIWYDSCRAPWRIANDYGWFGEARAKTFLDKLRTGSVSDSNPGNTTDQKNSALIGAFALSGISSDNTTMQKMCDNWESTQKDDKPYFQNTLRLLFMYTAAGLTSSGL